MALKTTCILALVSIGAFESEAGDELTAKEPVHCIFFLDWPMLWLGRCYELCRGCVGSGNGTNYHAIVLDY